MSGCVTAEPPSGELRLRTVSRVSGGNTASPRAFSPRPSSSWGYGSSIRRFARSTEASSIGRRRLVGFDNYKEIFTSDILLTAVKNNMIWVLVVPAFVTAIGLISRCCSNA